MREGSCHAQERRRGCELPPLLGLSSLLLPPPASVLKETHSLPGSNLFAVRASLFAHHVSPAVSTGMFMLNNNVMPCSLFLSFCYLCHTCHMGAGVGMLSAQCQFFSGICSPHSIEKSSQNNFLHTTMQRRKKKRRDHLQHGEPACCL